MSIRQKCGCRCRHGTNCQLQQKLTAKVAGLKQYPFFINTLTSIKFRRHSSRVEIPSSFLREYGHRFGENIHLRLPSGRLLLVHLNVVERQAEALSRVYMGRGWQDVMRASGLERGDHVIICLRAYSKFHIFVFDRTGRVKKERKVWCQKHKLHHDASPEEVNTVPSQVFAPSHAQQAGTQSCSGNEIDNSTSRSKETRGNSFSSSSLFPTFVKYLAPYSICSSARRSSYMEIPTWFMQRYGTCLQKDVSMTGPSGKEWLVKYGQRTHFESRRGYFTTGWTAFATNNDLKVKDKLLFTITSPFTIIVEVLETAVAVFSANDKADDDEYANDHEEEDDVDDEDYEKEEEDEDEDDDDEEVVGLASTDVEHYHDDDGGSMVVLISSDEDEDDGELHNSPNPMVPAAPQLRKYFKTRLVQTNL